MNNQVCGNWATFVLDQNKNGLNAEQIQNVYNLTASKSGAAKTQPITELCGTVPQILQAAGRK